MATEQRFEGPSLDDVLAQVRRALGDDAEILEANRIKAVGGIGEDRYEIKARRAPKGQRPVNTRAASLHVNPTASNHGFGDWGGPDRGRGGQPWENQAFSPSGGYRQTDPYPGGLDDATVQAAMDHVQQVMADLERKRIADQYRDEPGPTSLVDLADQVEDQLSNPSGERGRLGDWDAMGATPGHSGLGRHGVDDGLADQDLGFVERLAQARAARRREEPANWPELDALIGQTDAHPAPNPMGDRQAVGQPHLSPAARGFEPLDRYAPRVQMHQDPGIANATHAVSEAIFDAMTAAMAVEEAADGLGDEYLDAVSDGASAATTAGTTAAWLEDADHDDQAPGQDAGSEGQDTEGHDVETHGVQAHDTPITDPGAPTVAELLFPDEPEAPARPTQTDGAAQGGTDQDHDNQDDDDQTSDGHDDEVQDDGRQDRDDQDEHPATDQAGRNDQTPNPTTAGEAVKGQPAQADQFGNPLAVSSEAPLTTGPLTTEPSNETTPDPVDPMPMTPHDTAIALDAPAPTATAPAQPVANEAQAYAQWGASQVDLFGQWSDEGEGEESGWYAQGEDSEDAIAYTSVRNIRLVEWLNRNDLTPEAITQALEGLPKADALPQGPGVIVAVVGEGPLVLPLARRMAIELESDPAKVVLASEHRSHASVPDNCRISTVSEAALDRRAWRRRSQATLIAVDTSTSLAVNAQDWAREVLEELQPHQVIALVDAGRKAEDIARWIADLGGVDAIALTGLEETVSPHAIFELGIPVARLGHQIATSTMWADLLRNRRDLVL